ncbi:5-formyltetrahydrofolate cyclo-ligase [Cyanobacterium sp. IPPAS B-1200]|uniref:5-formyltetrahydrofolate cyclo-ligase n=1 Tax=Cyanobacterium sp. IPPAS B-1200 TaxID=1562720 RepID=UPI0008524BBF|nr:5-formyltetrahydrofolate cyclo-ligase [Cyanobacterium sp. IPPAS B-1200]OEJ79530.1 5-formyltetrahydrofolate cyclo-ligase [Cyanobacterium sp. IPPAS B-1200]
MNIAEQKRLLRKKYTKERSQGDLLRSTHLDHFQWQKKSDRISRNLFNHPLIEKSKVILSYISHRQEPDLSFLYRHHPITWGIPRCQDKDLIWHQWHWGKGLRKGAYGIFEPYKDSLKIIPEEVELILVPAVACDKKGYRLGYGGGFYDRLLSQKPWQDIPTMGIIFDFAYVDELPTEEWDQPLDYICTEKGIIELKKDL